MKIYTVQDRSILEKLARGEEFTLERDTNIFQNYEKSRIATSLLRKAFFEKNNITDERGLIYGFLEVREGEIHEIEDFYEFIQSNKNFELLSKLWNQFKEEDKVILELDVRDTDWNFVPINFGDLHYLLSQTEIERESKTFQKIIDTLKHGYATKGYIISNVIQVHLPVIKPNYVKNVYEMFDLVDKRGQIIENNDEKTFSIIDNAA